MLNADKKNHRNLIKKIKNYLSKFKSKNNNFFYFVTTSNAIGQMSLYSILDVKINLIKKIIYILKDIFYSSNYFNAHYFQKEKYKNYDKVIVTWGYKNQFNKNGTFDDKTLNQNSNSLEQTLWFVIYMSEQLPKKINKNIIILKSKNKKNYFLLIKNIIFSLKYIFYGSTFFFNKISSYNIFSKIFLKNFINFLNNKVRYVVIPYEGQPFQNELCRFLKKNFRNIKTIGYVHSSPLSIPFNLINKTNSPDKLIVNGSSQYKCLVKYLGWNKSKLKILPSKRFIKKKNEMSNSIYLPASFKSKNKIVSSVVNLLNLTKINITNYDIKNHPSTFSSKTHLSLIKELKKIMSLNKNLNSKKNVSIFIGASGAIIEALERGNVVYQICEYPLVEKYSNDIWENIRIKQLDYNIYNYSLKKKNAFIQFGSTNYDFKNYLRI